MVNYSFEVKNIFKKIEKLKLICSRKGMTIGRLKLIDEKLDEIILMQSLLDKAIVLSRGYNNTLFTEKAQNKILKKLIETTSKISVLHSRSKAKK